MTRNRVFTRVASVALALSLVARADAPSGRYSIAAGVVTDTATGLAWQQGISPSTMTWADAKTYCSSLSLNGATWRLPTIKELVTIVDETKTSSPPIDTTAFPNTPSEDFWSSSPFAHVPSDAWAVSFANGYVTGSLVAGSTLRARCVQ